MFGKNFELNNSHDNLDRARERQAKRYQNLAASALDAHDDLSAIYFYLLAFRSSGLENSSKKNSEESSRAATHNAGESHSSIQHNHVLSGADIQIIDGLRTAFKLAVNLKDRALAEHVFNSLEPFEDAKATRRATQILQKLALDRLEEFGLAREDMKRASDAVLDSLNKDSNSLHQSRGTGKTSLSAKTTQSARSITSSNTSSQSTSDKLDQVLSALHDADEKHSEEDEESDDTYATLVGYDRAIKKMKQYGIGAENDPKLKGFMDMLAARHGIASPVHTSSIIFRSFAREDADQFMAATANELDRPFIHMFMAQSPEGDPLLCTAASPDLMSSDSLIRTGALDRGTVILESIDTWGDPLLSEGQGEDGSARFSRGTRAVIDFIRAAVENPEVSVLASCASDSELSDFFYDLLSPFDFVDIKVPNAKERRDIWNDIVKIHPSIEMLDRGRLVQLTKHMSRYDIYHAAKEAVDQAYDESLSRHRYVPVSFGNLTNKIAAYQPLDSAEYKEIEDEALAQLRLDLDEYDKPEKSDASPEDNSQNEVKGDEDGNHPQM